MFSVSFDVDLINLLHPVLTRFFHSPWGTEYDSEC
jgi:hypothetical protein